MSKVVKMFIGGVLAVTTSLLLLQIEVGWYGVWWNWLLLMIIIVFSFSLGYWRNE